MTSRGKIHILSAFNINKPLANRDTKVRNRVRANLGLDAHLTPMCREKHQKFAREEDGEINRDAKNLYWRPKAKELLRRALIKPNKTRECASAIRGSTNKLLGGAKLDQYTSVLVCLVGYPSVQELGFFRISFREKCELLRKNHPHDVISLALRSRLAPENVQIFWKTS